MNDHGFHWTPCRPRGGGGGGGGAGLLVLAVVVIAACARPAERAAADLAEIAAVIVAVLAVTGCTVAALVWRARRRRARAELAARYLGPAARPVVLRAVTEPGEVGHHPGRAALEAPRPRVSAYPRIDVNPHVVTSDDDGDLMRSHCPYEYCHHNHPELPPVPWQRHREEGHRNG